MTGAKCHTKPATMLEQCKKTSLQSTIRLIKYNIFLHKIQVDMLFFSVFILYTISIILNTATYQVKTI
jgi:hypothetical protein